MSLLDPEDPVVREKPRDSSFNNYKRLVLFLGLFGLIGTFYFTRSSQNPTCQSSSIINNYYNISGISPDGWNINNYYSLGWPIRPPPEDLLQTQTTLCTKNNHLGEFSDYSETAQFQQLLYDFQNPRDCSKAKFLLRLEPWQAGFGSSIHTIASSMLKSLAHGRIYVEAPNQNWIFAATHCFDLKSSSECYFLPLSHCPLPTDWKALPEPQHALNPWISADIETPQYLVARQDYSFEPEQVALFPVFSHKSNLWWRAQLLRYIMRPNEFTWREILAPYFRLAFPPNGEIPQRFGSVFIRRGDKEKESPFLPLQSYMDKVQVLAEQHGIYALYVASDSQDAIDELLNINQYRYQNRYEVFYLPTKRTAAGWNDTLDLRVNHQAEISRLGGVTLVDIFISANAFFFVGTTSSNQCRLIDELRLASNNMCLEYVSLD